MKPRLSRSLMICLVASAVLLAGCGTGPSNPSSASSLTWKQVAIGDCTGLDEETTEGFLPDESKAKAGYTAVCWDNEQYTNIFSPTKAFCTYKKIDYGSCTGGENPGEMYTAVPRQ